MEKWIAQMAEHGALFIEGIASIIIVYAACRAAARMVWMAWIRGLGPRAGDPIRLDLGKTLSLALEFLVGADVLRSAISPTWNQLGELGAIVGIRSLLNYFLEREAENLEKEAEMGIGGFGKVK